MKSKYILAGIVIVAIAVVAYLGATGKLSANSDSASVYGIQAASQKSLASSASSSPTPPPVASGTIPIHVITGGVTPRPFSLATCASSNSSIHFVQPYAGATYNQGGYIPVDWSWTNPNPAAQTSIYLIPQNGGAAILYSQYSTVTNITTNGYMSVTAINGADVQSIIPSSVPAGQYRMEIVNGTNQFVGCSGVFTISPAPICTPTFGYLSQFGSYGHGNGKFNSPHGIAIDQSGNIYVVDQFNSRIQKFNSAGQYITQWGSLGNGNGQFYNPEGIAIDNQGNVYVSDVGQGTSRVQKFSPSGQYLSQIGTFGSGNGQFNSPNTLAIDSSGNMYVTDGGNSRVEKFNSAGQYVTQWGSYGARNGQFQDPVGIAIDSFGNVYVSNYGYGSNYNIQKFTSSGVYLSQWGSPGTGNGQFMYPSAISIDSSGNIYVLDDGNNRVQKFTSSGQYISQFGVSGSGNGQFSRPESLISSTSGTVYVSDTNNNRVQKFGMSICIQS